MPCRWSQETTCAWVVTALSISSGRQTQFVSLLTFCICENSFSLLIKPPVVYWVDHDPHSFSLQQGRVGKTLQRKLYVNLPLRGRGLAGQHGGRKWTVATNWSLKCQVHSRNSELVWLFIGVTETWGCQNCLVRNQSGKVKLGQIQSFLSAI